MEDIERAVKEQPEPEDLTGVDIGLDDKAIVDVYARERFNCASSYQILSVRAMTVKASVSANKGVGNTQAQQQFEKQLADLDRDLAHCLRGIKTIDKSCPAAKARMQELAAKT
jgi:hypothetical protein